MNNDTYTIEDLAGMTGLSTRTIRNYLADGQLTGEKAEGAWRFTAEQFGAFLAQPMVRQSVQAKAHGMVYDFLLQNRRASPAACTVLDLPTEEDDALRAALLEQVNALGLRLHYRCEHGMVRAILVGPPGDVARLMAALEL